MGRGIYMMCGVRDGRRRCDVLGFEGFRVGSGGGVEMVGLILLLTMLFYFKKTIQGSL